ncbi:hypothetical protein TPY_1466 [Sulfobacillus acidophilus TPY]|uniref:PD-(D/E)XK endonuclease-like domain-containing protein n=1 Tax=Sulfobacillus acidophilus (strain ATCC 700253 / DSM 10332 / NAL) TaxID=679936 RepID=G8U0H7_SULAD|nr:hypothetical protein TPY_1466 [Sulfobacillus acidophilus TPY]AEW04199.1 hypothetical protein Sulac_0691 [Sulfobacillus acidophilus DSM 10332]
MDAPAPLSERPLLSTQALWHQHLQQRLMEPPPFDPTEIRLSEAGQCPRRQTLRALGYAAALPTPRELAIFETGHWVEDRLAALWEARHPGQVNRQVTVTSPFGTGHIDLYIEPLNHIVECKTTTEKRRTELPLKSHVDQVTLYLHYWGNARGATAEIAYYIKETGNILAFPVTYDAARARELIVGLMEVQYAIQLTREPLPIPDDYQATQYPCAWYTADGLARCPYWEHCWGSSVTPMPDKKLGVVAVAPALAGDVDEYATIRQKQQALKGQLDILAVRREQLEAGFRTLLDERRAQALRAGDLTIKRTPIAGRTTVDLKAAIADGVVTEAQLQPYTVQHEGYDRWTVQQAKPRQHKQEG